MLNSAFTTGLALCATLIVAIGAQNAFVLRQGLRREHVLLVVSFCTVADFLLIAAGVAGLARILDGHPHLTSVLTIGGAVFLAWYGARALLRALRSHSLVAGQGPDAPSWHAVLAQVAAFTLLNPHVYLDTVLLMGAIGSRQPPAERMWFVAGAACASALWFTSLGFGARLLSRWFARPRAWRILDTLVGATMLLLAWILLMQMTSHHLEHPV